ncbi:MAG TPA: efflux RND transporter permease subunit, partial [Gemmataceae bacterium]|nr:efflux RND transporter permease subunit [Gemmataceae bacterium]
VRPRLVPVERERGKQGDEETGRKDSAPLSMSPATAGPGILVETVYPGANAAVVSETVRAPIEQQVGGIEKLRFMRSRCSSDGKYALALTFERGGDLHKMHMLTQNRVNLAVPLLPDVVKQAGVSVKQATSGVLLIVNLFSPDARYDQLYLSNYATIQIKDELARVSGVGEVTLIGPSDCSMRLWLDPDRLAARNLSASDVVRALREQNVQVGGQKLGQPPVPKGEGFQYTLNTLGRLTDPDQFAGIILKTDGEGRLVRLKDVAEVELGAGQRRSQGLLDGKPVVSLVIRPTGEVGVQKVGAALKKRLGGLRSRFPNGLEFAIAFDFTANHEAAGQAMAAEYLLLDLDFPRTLANERTDRVLSHCEKLLREVAGVEHVLALSENPFDLFGSGPCLLVRLTPAKQRGFSRDKIIETIRGRFGAIEEATMRIRDLSEPGSFPRCGYPIDVALYGPEPDRVREWAKTLGERLAQSKKLTDVWVNRDSAPRPQQFVDINREKAAMLGVSLEDVLTTLQVHAGGRDVSDFNRFGRTGRVVVQTAGGSGEWAKDLRKLKVRNTASQMIPLNALVTVHESDAPLVLDFLEGWPMVGITANPAPGVSVEQGRKLCEALADEVRNELGLAATYRLTWLQEIRRPK